MKGGTNRKAGNDLGDLLGDYRGKCDDSTLRNWSIMS